MTVISAGRRASSSLRARIALDQSQVRAVLRAPRPGIREMLALSTCHRTELYLAADDPVSDAVHVAVSLLPGIRPADHSELEISQGEEAVRHLFRVTCGLESLVIGEPQILAQVRAAYASACEEGAAGPVLRSVVPRALSLGREVRSTTALSGASGIGGLAARELSERLGGLKGVRGAVVGSGEAATDVALALRARGALLTVVGRSQQATARLAQAVSGQPSMLDKLPAVLGRSTFGVVAVSGGVIVEHGQIPPRLSSEPLLIMDLSVPAAVRIDGRTDVELRSIDDLTPSFSPEADGELAEVTVAIEHALEKWRRWLDGRPAGRQIGDLRSQAERVVRSEVSAALAQMGLSDEQAARVDALALRIMNKLMHGPSVAMRDADEETRRLILSLFPSDP
ncbi:MAG: glutamyl-tRNA reductase [Actinomycetota bacterium]